MHDLLVPVILEQTDSVILITEIRLRQQAKGMELQFKSGLCECKLGRIGATEGDESGFFRVQLRLSALETVYTIRPTDALLYEGRGPPKILH